MHAWIMLWVASCSRRSMMLSARAWVLQPKLYRTKTRSLRSSTHLAARPKAFLTFDDFVDQRSVPSVLSDEDFLADAANYDPSLYDEGGDASNMPPLPDDFFTKPPVYDEDEEVIPAPRGIPAPAQRPSTVEATPQPSELPPVVESTAQTTPNDLNGFQFASLVAEAVPEETMPSEPSEYDKPVVPRARGSYKAPSRPPPRSPPSSHTHVADLSPTDSTWAQNAATGQPTTDTAEHIRTVQMPAVQKDIAQITGQPDINLNSPTQVSLALFGVPKKSTQKAVLEGMAAAGSRLADLILQYRALKATAKRLERKALHQAQGTHVSSVTTVQRPTTAAQKSNTGDNTQQVDDEPSDPLLLVDASSYIFRAYFSMPAIHRADGMPTGAVLGFCNMLNRLILHRLVDGEQPRLILAFDSPGPSFRKDLYPEYKANRPEAPVDLIPQFNLIRQAAEAYGLPLVEESAFEADDVIATLATLAHRQGLDVHILSGDKDLMQLVTEENIVPCIHMIDPMSMSRITHQQVEEKWGVGPTRLGDILALAGDSADNVPGVPGIGPKIASALLTEYGDLENLLENAENIKQKSRREKLLQFSHQARLSRALVALEDNIPGMANRIGDLPSWRSDPLDVDRLEAFFDEMGFKDLKRRFANQLKRGAPRKRPKSTRNRERAMIPDPEDFADVPF